MPTILSLFLIAAIGYLIGELKIKGLSLGTSGVLLTALVFGHYGVEMPAVIRDFGLVLFVGSVGLIAGPVFFRNFRRKVYAYLLLGVLIVVVGSIATVVFGKLFKIPFDLAIGMFTGALTSTPGLAAATESTEMILGAGNSLASVGYGIAYPFGVVGVVLFVQLMPKLIRCNMPEEIQRLHTQLHNVEHVPDVSDANCPTRRATGILVAMVAMLFGVLVGSVHIPLPGGLQFSLGTSGGPLLTGLIVGHFNKIGAYSFKAPDSLLKSMRELGLCLFLLGAGTDAGSGFLEILHEYGIMLFLVGVLITLLPMIAACLVAKFLLRLDVLSTLGSVCGGMTSTPALGALISSCGTEDVTTSYAATYPFALICVVLGTQIMTIIW